MCAVVSDHLTVPFDPPDLPDLLEPLCSAVPLNNTCFIKMSNLDWVFCSLIFLWYFRKMRPVFALVRAARVVAALLQQRNSRALYT